MVFIIPGRLQLDAPTANYVIFFLQCVASYMYSNFQIGLQTPFKHFNGRRVYLLSSSRMVTVSSRGVPTITTEGVAEVTSTPKLWLLSRAKS